MTSGEPTAAGTMWERATEFYLLLPLEGAVHLLRGIVTNRSSRSAKSSRVLTEVGKQSLRIGLLFPFRSCTARSIRLRIPSLTILRHC